MPTFSISDVTPAGAYANAVMVARESDRRSANRRFEPGEGVNVLKSLKTLVRRAVAVIAEKRPAVSQPTAHYV
jgi:hypothetical protein